MSMGVLGDDVYFRFVYLELSNRDMKHLYNTVHGAQGSDIR